MNAVESIDDGHWILEELFVRDIRTELTTQLNRELVLLPIECGCLCAVHGDGMRAITAALDGVRIIQATNEAPAIAYMLTNQPRIRRRR